MAEVGEEVQNAQVRLQIGIYGRWRNRKTEQPTYLTNSTFTRKSAASPYPAWYHCLVNGVGATA